MKLSQLPSDIGAEIAFVGRSNAGKSSAINSITSHKNIARVSKTPGRTQCINIFDFDDVHRQHKRLIDLPGYGYAKVPLKLKQSWETLLSDYFQTRQSLKCLCLIMDIRHPLQPLDHQLIHWGLSSNLAVHILLTKSDKFSRGKSLQVLLAVQKKLSEDFQDQAVNIEKLSCQIFSSVNGQGLSEARSKITHWLSCEE